jgi:hypothetical protein
MNHNEIHFRTARCLLCLERINQSDKALPSMSTLSALCIHVLNQSIATDNPHAARVVKCQGDCFQCWRRPSRCLWYHTLCYTILSASYRLHRTSPKPDLQDIRDFGLATQAQLHLWDETTCKEVIKEGLCSPYTEGVLKDSFSQEKLLRLPAEVLDMIARFIGDCAYLVVLGQTRRLVGTLQEGRGAPVTGMPVDLSSRVYTSEVLFQNASYLSRISNLEAPLHQRILHHGYQVRRIVLSKDDFGVRNIRFFDTCSSSVAHDGSPWYENLIIDEEALDVKIVGLSNVSHSVYVVGSVLIESKGLILRSVQLNSKAIPVIEWDTPNPPEMEAANIYSCVMDSPDRRRMQYHPLPKTLSGLTVCCRDGKMIGLFVHSSEASSHSTFVDSIQSRFPPQDLVWIFFPIEKGERILNVWVRRFQHLEGVASRPSIMVKSAPS